ncbi:hypothetical protein C8K11_102329 [Novosphingobium sp. GV055]|nr:hypothetical protein C8K11_102329 [Novosphingobium sp. GV055]PUB06653.1 hypothetical protein C8K12_102329 [Novosphingobium sp. GV061]PUB22704.1 hypothetical protein C8K14_102329 [Novosphingobium sp. GV079]PUB44729.1 hypothetical protein C8K10_102329 [Novosphingobium sp. GV027]
MGGTAAINECLRTIVNAQAYALRTTPEGDYPGFGSNLPCAFGMPDR